MKLHIAQGRNPLLEGGVRNVKPLPPDQRAFHPPSSILHPVPRDQWPTWALILSLAATDADTGIGDTVARIFGPANSAAFKAWHFKKFGQTCGCTERQREWNVKYPLLR